MGGGGQTQSKTSGDSSYPPEFRPLADAARKQIEALQARLPLAAHAEFQPAGVAGMSPIEQYAIEDLVMRTPYLPSSMQGIFELPESVGAASRGAVKSGEMTEGARGAFDMLSGLLGRDVRPSMPVAPQAFPTMTRFPMPETAFPGLSRSRLEAVRPGIATRPVPMMTPLPSPPQMGPMPSAPAPQAAEGPTAMLLAARQAEDASATQQLAAMGIVPPPGIRPSDFLRQILAAQHGGSAGDGDSGGGDSGGGGAGGAGGAGDAGDS